MIDDGKAVSHRAGSLDTSVAGSRRSQVYNLDMRLLALLLFCFAAWAEDPKEKVKLPAGRPDLARGEKLFLGHCALCHGTRGDGGRGPSLLRRRLSRAPDDAALVKVIAEGINGTEMPGAWQMNPREHRQVAAYVRSLGRVPATPVPGEPKRGEQLYVGKGTCATCHAINRKGGTLGPDLSDAGERSEERRVGKECRL